MNVIMAWLFQWFNNLISWKKQIHFGGLFSLKEEERNKSCESLGGGKKLGNEFPAQQEQFGCWGSSGDSQISGSLYWPAPVSALLPFEGKVGLNNSLLLSRQDLFVIWFFFPNFPAQEAAVQWPQSTHWRPNKIRNITNPSALSWKRWQVSIAKTQNISPILAV